MFTAESIKLLAKPARAAHGYRSRYSDQNIDLEVCEPPPPLLIADDPNDSPDPDDACPPPSQPLPAMPCSWWIRMTLDPPDTPVSLKMRGCVCR